jgi:hypothetical protein
MEGKMKQRLLLVLPMIPDRPKGGREGGAPVRRSRLLTMQASIVAGLAVLTFLVTTEATAQRVSTSQIQELVEGSRPLPEQIPAGRPSPAYDGTRAAPAPEIPGYDDGSTPVPEAPIYMHGASGAGMATPTQVHRGAGSAPGTPAQVNSEVMPAPEGPPEDMGSPLASSFGTAEGEWGVYQAPDYEDGLTSVGPCCEACGHSSNCLDTWEVGQRVFIWARNKPRLINISALGSFSDTSTFNLTQVMGTRNAVFDGAVGYGANVRHYLSAGQENRDLYLEGVYFGQNNWQEFRAKNATSRLVDNTFTNFPITYGNLFTQFTTAAGGPQSGIGGFDRADHHEMFYQSKIHNVEINIVLEPRSRADRIVLHPNGRWRRECVPGIYGSYLLGFRYFELNESFSFLGTGETDIFDSNGNLVLAVPTRGEYNVKTFNDLLGVQAGMELMYRHCMWEWGGQAKVAPCVNFTSQRSTIVTSAASAGDPFASADLNEFRTDSNRQIALLGEVSVVGLYHVYPSLTLRASFDFMWAVGVSLAPEQIQFQTNPPPRVNNNGLAFYQGLSLGLIWTR